YAHRDSDSIDFHSNPTRRSSDLGSQLVGPGTQIPQSGSSGQNSGSGTSGGTSSENSQTSSSGSSAGQSLIQPSGNSGNRTSTQRSEEHTSELQSRFDLVCRLLLD